MALIRKKQNLSNLVNQVKTGGFGNEMRKGAGTLNNVAKIAGDIAGKKKAKAEKLEAGASKIDQAQLAEKYKNDPESLKNALDASTNTLSGHLPEDDAKMFEIESRQRAEGHLKTARANELRFSTSAYNMGMKDIYAKNKTNPAMIAEESKKLQEKVLGEMTEGNKETFNMLSAGTEQNYRLQADSNLEQLQKKKEVESTKILLDSFVSTQLDTSEGIFSGVKNNRLQQKAAMEEVLTKKNPDGTFLISPERQAATRAMFEQTAVTGFQNNLDERYVTNTQQAMNFSKEVISDPDAAMKKYGLDRKEYNQVRAYASRRLKAQEDLAEANKKAANKKSQAEIDALADENTRLGAQFDSMEFKKDKDGNFLMDIENETYDTSMNLVLLMDEYEDLASRGGIKKTSAGYRSKMSVMIRALGDKIKKEEDSLGSRIRQSSDEELMSLINTHSEGLYQPDKADIYRRAVARAVEENVNLNSAKREDIEKTRNFFNTAMGEYVLARNPQIIGSDKHADMIVDSKTGMSVLSVRQEGEAKIARKAMQLKTSSFSGDLAVRYGTDVTARLLKLFK